MPQDECLGELEENGVILLFLVCPSDPRLPQGSTPEPHKPGRRALTASLGGSAAETVSLGRVLRVRGPGRQPSAQSLDVAVLQVL